VRLLKLTLPTSAALIALAFPIYSYMVAPATVAVDADSSAVSDGKLVMANPKLEGVTQQDRPYTMTAQRAIQDVTKDGIVEFESIDARLPMGAEASVKVLADAGVYDSNQNTVRLS